jgi:hypothetical protein
VDRPWEDPQQQSVNQKRSKPHMTKELEMRFVISSPVAPDLYNGGVVKGRARSNHYGQTSGY